MRRVFVWITFLLVAGGAVGGEDKVFHPARVFVYADGPRSGFVDDTSKDAGDSVKDLNKVLESKWKYLSLVSNQEGADVTVHVLTRAQVATGDYHGGRVPFVGIWMTQEKLRQVPAELTAADYSVALVGRGSSWTLAAEDLADQIEKWVKNNGERLYALRAKASPSPSPIR